MKNSTKIYEAKSKLTYAVKLDIKRAWLNTGTIKEPQFVPIPTENVVSELRDELEVMKQEMSYLTYKHGDAEVEKGNGYANAKSRDLFRDDDIYVPESWAQPYRVKEIIRTQAYECLSTNTKRNQVAKAFEFLGWDATYEEVRDCLDAAAGEPSYLKRYQYDNIQRSGKRQNAPVIHSPKLMLPVVNNQLSVMSVDYDRSLITLVVLVKDKQYKLEYRIPKRIRAHRDSIIKISKPSLSFDDEEQLASIFTVTEKIIVQKPMSNSVLAFDLGKCDDNPFVAARVYRDGRVSEAVLPSVETMSVWGKIRHLEEELSFCKARRDRLYWENHVVGRLPLDDNIEQLSAKLTRLKNHLSWLIARDLLHVALPGETIVTEDLSWLVGAGKWSFGDVIDAVRHACARDGRDFVIVSATRNSKTCPCCGEALVPDSSRLSSCECGWSANRDLSACAVMGRKFFKFKRGQSRLARVSRGIPRRERVKSLARPVSFRGSGVLVECGVRVGVVSRRAVVRGLSRPVLSGVFLVGFLDFLVGFLESCVAGTVFLVPKQCAEFECGNPVDGIVAIDDKINHGYGNHRSKYHLRYNTIPS